MDTVDRILFTTFSIKWLEVNMSDDNTKAFLEQVYENALDMGLTEDEAERYAEESLQKLTY